MLCWFGVGKALPSMSAPQAPAPAPPREVVDDGASTASIDLSELFNPSALTRLLKQLNATIDAQRDQIVVLEEESIANAAFREMWAEDRAEFRAALARREEENNTRLNEAIGAAAASVASLRKRYDEERAFRRICHFVAHRTEIVCRRGFEAWSAEVRRQRLGEQRRAVLLQMVHMNEKRFQIFGLRRWVEQTGRARDAAMLHTGANALVDALYVKRQVRRSFRHWVEMVLVEQISDAFGGVHIASNPGQEKGDSTSLQRGCSRSDIRGKASTLSVRPER